ncbi:MULTISPECIES: DUF2231 domain-containing protein [Micromonospora]|uniref:DUF2231 domain-containing protein n=1 Tax=Micromonospora solifontis TaxID=2487138 RepID=A0ABX9WB40_9ACTN|nr:MULTISPECIES: DUF2231 domain-containing protein [Micromonospora]NES14192.1 hypothetical protein [Micromonospora sp. PPF5-17B]NES39580.1 hypothetical protein [Micromonospora solifontis]NES55859.1 hypothetical protein [Micromonospora sp. PPF5-6]RNL88040.1 hypothetical protein EFE23_26230 [Micromonospora solifontis]
MFKEFNGLPAHALLVHAAVVLVPLLALVSVAYGVLPRWRPRLDWAVAALAITAPIAAFLATESGEALEHVLEQKNYPAQILDKVREHSEYGESLRSFTFGLAAAALLLLLVTSGFARVRNLPRWIAPVLTGVVAVLAVFAVVYVYLAGDTGAQAVWGGTL